jgi:hypothetical protein
MIPKAKQGGTQWDKGERMRRSDGTCAAREYGKERREDAKVGQTAGLLSAVENHGETKRERGERGRERGRRDKMDAPVAPKSLQLILTPLLEQEKSVSSDSNFSPIATRCCPAVCYILTQCSLFNSCDERL